MGAEQHSLSVDVAVVGGGLVGACLATALRGGGLSVALIERGEPPAGQPAWDERTIALNAASRELLERIGLWPQLSDVAAPIVATHISERGRLGVARFSAAQAGVPALGYNLPIRRIGEAALAAAKDASEVRWLCPAQLRAVAEEPDARVVQLDDGRIVRARLLVAADGTGSPTRRALGIPARCRDYGQQALVTAAEFERSPDGVAYERFTPEGPIGVLPRHEGHCAVIRTMPETLAAEARHWDDDALREHLQAGFGMRLGRLRRLGRRMWFPLRQVVAERVHAPRAALVGNAAQTLHPVAAQGFNLGLRDAVSLAEALRGAGDPGDADLLSAWAEQRQADRRRVAAFTDGVVRLFSNRLPGLAGLRHLGLLGLELMPALHRRVLQQNLGWHSGVAFAPKTGLRA